MGATVDTSRCEAHNAAGISVGVPRTPRSPRCVRAKSPPISRDYLARLPPIADAEGRVFDAADPESLAYEEMLRALADVPAAVGHR